MLTDKPYSPACDRNKAPILSVLREQLRGDERVLEIGSGTGQHAVHFAAAMPGVRWQCSDLAAALDGIQLWLDEAGLPNTPPPIPLDCGAPRWPSLEADCVFSANAIHIMGWAQVESLFDKLQAVIRPGGLLILYGPFNVGGRYSSPSNAEFDEWLKQRDPASGIRDLEAVDVLASSIGLEHIGQVPMPANNFCMIWRRV